MASRDLRLTCFRILGVWGFRVWVRGWRVQGIVFRDAGLGIRDWRC